MVGGLTGGGSMIWRIRWSYGLIIVVGNFCMMGIGIVGVERDSMRERGCEQRCCRMFYRC